MPPPSSWQLKKPAQGVRRQFQAADARVASLTLPSGPSRSRRHLWKDLQTSTGIIVYTLCSYISGTFTKSGF